jgi:uncharacterized membrane protein YfcA
MASVILIALGVLVGVLAGIVGLGGGFVVVPLLRYCYGFSQTMAQGTSLAMLLPPIGILAAWQYWKAGQMNITVAMLLAAGFLIGGYIGGAFAVKLPALTLQRVFGAFFLLVSLRMLIGK